LTKITFAVVFKKDLKGSKIMRGKSLMKTCPFCKNGFLERKTIRETYTYKDHAVELDQPGEWCHACGESILNGEDLKATEKQIRDFQAKEECKNEFLHSLC
jgi:YgiT-type zinc finger domain-containing protein